MNTQNKLIRYNLILGSKRISNYFWLMISFLGGTGFFLAGLSSYLQIQILPFTKVDNISFIPQGIVMTFYGSVGIFLSLFLFTNIIFNVGGGFNKYDKNLNKVEIFRLGFPTQNREIYLSYNFKDIMAVVIW